MLALSGWIAHGQALRHIQLILMAATLPAVLLAGCADTSSGPLDPGSMQAHVGAEARTAVGTASGK
jgi:outer membrane murein-binding lipoprotein Lpp